MDRQTLPAWLKAQGDWELPRAKTRFFSGGYLEKTRRSIALVFQDDWERERQMNFPGLLQRYSAPAKLIAVGLTLLAVTMVSAWPVLAGWLMLLVLVAWRSGLAGRWLLRRLSLLLLFPICLALPAITGWVTPGTSMGTQGVAAYVTWQGLLVAGRLVLRTLDSLLLLQLLLATTRWVDITQGLRCLGLGPLWTGLLDLTYRYLFLLLPLMGEYLEGRKSRLTGQEGNRSALAWIGQTTAGFFRIAWEYNIEIAQAIQARSFSFSRNQRTNRWRPQGGEGRFLVMVVLFCGYSIWLK